MIVYSIDKYKDRWAYQYTPPTTRPSIAGREMGKLEYALYIKNLGYKKGDLIVKKHAMPPYLHNEVYKVYDIMELHRFVQWGGEGIGPRCLVLQDIQGYIVPGYAGADMFKKVEYSNCPEGWKKQHDCA